MKSGKDKNVNEPCCCSKCGDSTAPLYQAHTRPTVVDELIGMGKRAKRKRAPIVGPEALIPIAEGEEESGEFAAMVNMLLGPLEAGELVQLCFRVTDKDPSWLTPGLRRQAQRMAGETMWVRITAARGVFPDVKYVGELCNVPIFIDPKKLQWGSRVSFSAKHIRHWESLEDECDCK